MVVRPRTGSPILVLFPRVASLRSVTPGYRCPAPLGHATLFESSTQLCCGGSEMGWEDERPVGTGFFNNRGLSEAKPSVGRARRVRL